MVVICFGGHDLIDRQVQHVASMPSHARHGSDRLASIVVTSPSWQSSSSSQPRSPQPLLPPSCMWFRRICWTDLIMFGLRPLLPVTISTCLPDTIFAQAPPSSTSQHTLMCALSLPCYPVLKFVCFLFARPCPRSFWTIIFDRCDVCLFLRFPCYFSLGARRSIPREGESSHQSQDKVHAAWFP